VESLRAQPAKCYIMADRNHDGVSNYLDDMPISMLEGYTMLDRDGDGKIDYNDADERRGLWSTMGIVARISQPLSAYTEERMRSGHRIYNAGRWGDPLNARRPDKSGTVLRLDRRCREGSLVGSRPLHIVPSLTIRNEVDYDAVPTPPDVCRPPTTSVKRRCLLPAPMTARVPASRPRRLDTKLTPVTARPSLREAPVGSVEAKSRWFESSHPSWALAHTWEYEHMRHAIERASHLEHSARRRLQSHQAALRAKHLYPCRKLASEQRVKRIIAASQAAAHEEIRFLPKLPEVAALARQTWARESCATGRIGWLTDSSEARLRGYRLRG